MAVDPSKIQPEWMYSVSEAAGLLEVGEQSVRLYLNEGKLRGRKTQTKRWRIPGSELLRYIQGGESNRNG